MFDSFGRFIKTALLVTAVVLVALPGSLSARKPGATGKARHASDTELSVISRMFTTTNNIIFGVDNRGNLGKDPGGSSTTSGGYWRSRTDNYVFQSGLHVAGLFDRDGDGIYGDTVETEAVYDEEWREGKASVGQDDPSNRLYSSASAIDLEAWPDEFRGSDGKPKVYGQQDIVCIYTDVGGPVNPTAGMFRLGVETYQRVKLFSVSSQKDIMYVEWRFKNASQYVNEDVNGDGAVDVAGPYTIKDMLAIINTDFDIGDADDDRAAVSPKFNMSIYWDSDFSEGNFTSPVGFLAMKFLDSPAQVGRPVDGVDNDKDGQVDEEGEANRIGMTGFTITTNRGGPREDPNTDAEAYRIMVNAPGEITEPQWDAEADLIVSDFEDDLRARLLTGPFDLPADGSFQKVEVGYFFSEPQRSPANPLDITIEGELKPLIGLAQTVQTTFDTEFNLPSPPVSPNVKLLEKDGMVIITWDDLPESSPDPFYPVSQVAANPDGTPAATYNPNYLEYDFQGYRVYRSLTTNLEDARLVGQFDKSDGITSTSAKYVTQQGADLDGDGVADFPDTEKDPFDIGKSGDDDVKDTGVRYILVDRGQGLSGGREGLINGIKYYYAVTAFDYQPSNLGQESLESGVQLIALDQSGNNLREGVPRSSINGFIPASVEKVAQVYPDGSELGEPPVMHLTAQGLLEETTPQPAADNGLVITDVTLAEGNPAVLPTQLVLEVDSVINVPNDFDAGMGFYHDAQFQVHLTAKDGQGLVLGQSIISSMGKYDPWGGTIELSGSIPLKKNGAVIASLDVTVYADNWDGFVVEPIQVSGNIQYDNVKQGNQRTHLTNYFWYSAFYGPDEAMSMAPLANSIYLGHVVAGTRSADIELRWVADGSDLTLQVTDLSSQVPVRFNEITNDGWGFVPKTGSALDVLVDHQTAEWMFDNFYGTATPGMELIANEVTLADGTTRPYAVDDGVRRNFKLVRKLGEAIKPSDYDVLGTEIVEDGEVVDEIGDRVADLSGTQDLDLYVCGVMYQINGITRLPAAGDVWKVRMRQHPSAAQNPYRAGAKTFPGVATYNHRRPVAGNRWVVDLNPDQVNLAARDLDRIKVVPNPYVASNALDLTPNQVQLQFVNLPGSCTIRIYTVAGNLVDVIEHNDMSGTAMWDIRSRYSQKIASGYYIYHVEDHETGQKQMGKFAIIH